MYRKTKGKRDEKKEKGLEKRKNIGKYRKKEFKKEEKYRKI